jgi:ribosomal protein S18 acetylase RimI-like enzyme
MIKQAQYSELEKCASVIRESFATVAKEFNITEEIWPAHVSFTQTGKLQYHWDSGFLMYGYYLNGDIIGYAALDKKDENIYELRNLAVLPEFRHKGCGKELIDFCVSKARELGGNKIILSIIEENTRLKNWYLQNGFTHTGAKKWEHFTEGFMEMKI